jgi:hypothetical protein
MGPNQQPPVPPSVNPAVKSTAPSGMTTGIKGPVKTTGGDEIVGSAKSFAKAAGAK